MNPTTPPSQPEGAKQARAGAVQHLLNHRATLPMLAAVLVVVAGVLALAFMPKVMADQWRDGVLWGVFVLASVVVCGVAYLQDKRRDSQLMASANPTQLRKQQLYRRQLQDLPPDFTDLRERLCQGIGGGDAEKWRSRIDSAIFPRANLKDVVERWLRNIFTVADGPLQRALLAKGGGPLRKNKLLEPADLGIPLPGERRSPHMTPAWYADQVARAAKKTGTPAWRMYLNFAVILVSAGAVAYLVFIADAPFLTVASASIFGVLFMLASMMWSIGTNPGADFAWRSMARYLVVELHASAPHALQPGCLDTECPNNTDTSMA